LGLENVDRTISILQKQKNENIYKRTIEINGIPMPNILLTEKSKPARGRKHESE
jgi:hypothetical protein